MNKLLLSTILITFLIILSGFALADYTIESLDFNVGVNPITHILPQHAQVIDVVLNISTNETITNLNGDLTQINPNPTKFLAYQNKVFTCSNNKVENTTYYNCRINKVVFIPQSTSTSINFTIFNEEETTNIVHNITFSLDDTNPTVDTFETEFCIGDKCFLPNSKPTKIFISLTDSIATFYQEKIFFLVGDSSSQRVTSCDGNDCEGIYTETSCYAGERVQAKIVTAQGVASSDDAGNPISEDLIKTFICDEHPPGKTNLDGEDVAVKFNVTHSGGVLFNQPKSGDTVTVTAIVSEDASGVTASANFSKLGGAYQYKLQEVIIPS